MPVLAIEIVSGSFEIGSISLAGEGERVRV
jgi:hypothetical protein